MPAAPRRLPKDDTSAVRRLRGDRGLLDFNWQLPATMSLDNTGRLYLERQVTLARVIFAALSLVVLLETSGMPVRRLSVWVLGGYLALALSAALIERALGEPRIRVPLAVDFIVLAAFLYLTPSVSAFWFLFLFAVFVLATRGGRAYGTGWQSGLGRSRPASAWGFLARARGNT